MRLPALVSLTIAALLTALPTWSGAQAAAAQTAQPAVAPARPTDVSSIDAIIAALYDVISGPAGQKRDWQRFHSLFAPGARLIPTGAAPGGPGRAVVQTPAEYAERAAPILERDGFFEREIGRSVDTFGRITQVFSVYDSKRLSTDTAPFQRGINSIQLLNDGSRWWIITVYWDAERPDNPIPARYLNRASVKKE